MSALSAKIQQIQTQLNVPPTGVYDLVTLQMLSLLLKIIPIVSKDGLEDKKIIQQKLGFSGNEVDGILGNNSTQRILDLVSQLPDHSSKSLSFRIKAMQSILKLPQSGVYDLVTLVAIEKILKILPNSTKVSLDNAKRLQSALGFKGKDVDGVLGRNSTQRIELLLAFDLELKIPNSEPLNIRIKNIQKKLHVIETGFYNLQTINALERALGIKPISLTDTLDSRKRIQRKLGFTSHSVDGIFGVNTTTKIEEFLNRRLPEIPAGASLIVSKQSMDMIVEFEVGSVSYYQTHLIHPVWPGGDSGITIGIGYDLGYVTLTKFMSDWSDILDHGSIQKLSPVIGLKGSAAKNKLTKTIKEVIVPINIAKTIFYTRSLPVYAKATSLLYPGIELLPPDAQGAILSLIYNRGTGINGPTRIEMFNIKEWVVQQDLSKIAKEIRAMKRLWQGKGLDGLLKRREKEAKMVENADYFFNNSDIFFA